MADDVEPDEPESPLSPAQEEEVRRLLADARHTEPMPPEVAARMDNVLADLADEPSRRAPVVQLATRRRRAATLLVAAAAVVVVGIGIGQVVGAGSGGDADTSGAADSEAEAQDNGTELSAPNADSGTAAVPQPQRGAEGTQDYLPKASFTLDPDELAGGLRQLQRYADRIVVRNDASAGTDGLARLDACPTRKLGAGTFVFVDYGGDSAVVVLRPPEGDTQVADVYLCGSSDPVRSLTLRLPPP